MVYESALELHYLYLCDFDPTIRDFQSQPFQIDYHFEGRERKYTPDVCIDDARLIEVKPERRTLKPEFRRWTTTIREASADCGYTFEVITETEIRRQPRLDNVVLLRRYQRQAVSEEILLHVGAWTREAPGISLGEIFTRLGRTEVALTSIYGLLARHDVCYDVHLPINNDLPIFPN